MSRFSLGSNPTACFDFIAAPADGTSNNNLRYEDLEVPETSFEGIVMKKDNHETTVNPLPGYYGNEPKPTKEDIAFRDKIARDPVEAACECRNNILSMEQGYYKRLYKNLQFAYSIAYYLKRHPEKYKEFMLLHLSSNSGKDKSYKTKTQPLRHVLNFVFGAKSEQAKNRVSKYSTALMPHFILGLPPHLVTRKIVEAGGIEPLYEQALSGKKAESRVKPDVIPAQIEESPIDFQGFISGEGNQKELDLDFESEVASPGSLYGRHPDGLVPFMIYIKLTHRETINGLQEGVSKNIRIVRETIDDQLIYRGSTPSHSKKKRFMSNKSDFRSLLAQAFNI